MKNIYIFNVKRNKIFQRKKNLFVGQKGNLTERMISVVLSIGLSIASVFGAVYMLIWQTYVLRIEAVLAAIQIAFIGLEFIFGIISVVTFAR